MKAHFSRFLSSVPGRLHAAAHSHHPWPDVTLAAHQQAWEDAAAYHDDKWEEIVFADVLPRAQAHVARVLGLPDPASVAFGPNTHEFVRRIVSCLPERPQVLTTDGEFHSFARQIARLEEADSARVQRVAVEPFASFSERFAGAAAAGSHDLVFVSQVLFGSGFVVPDLADLIGAVPSETYVVVDGYHGFMALPTDFGPFAERAFYLAGGYKYAMAGEGCAFVHCPPGYGTRPVDTGWFAGFGALPEGGGVEGSGAAGAAAMVAYPDDARRFLGSTFDPTGLYRFNAVQQWLAEIGWDVERIHAHVADLQQRLLDRLDDESHEIRRATLVPSEEDGERGHFLSFGLPNASEVHRRLAERKVITDHRQGRLRIGLGIYHDADDLEVLIGRLAEVLGGARR